jgi:putative DNA primase/helicase
MNRPVVTYPPDWIDRIPDELKCRKQWVVWRYEWRPNNAGGGKWTKVPYQVRKTGGRHRKAKADQPTTWATFSEALAVYQANADRTDGEQFDGIGYEFASDDDYAGVDLDDSLDADGEVQQWAAEWLERLGPTYAEVSPSGTGIKAFFRGKLPAKPDGKTGRRRAGYGPNGSGEIEAYDHGRYFTPTRQSRNQRG